MCVNPTYNFKLVSFNCKSIKRSFDDVRGLCEVYDLLALQETWLFPHDIPILGTLSNNFDYTGKSAIDSSAGLLAGRPYGGVAILWRKGTFNNVTVLHCKSNRLAAIRASLNGRSIVVITAYMPTDCPDNLPTFVELLGEINAIVASDDVESVFVLGDFNAHPGSLFFKELQNFCSDQSWVCADCEILGLQSSTYTFVSEAHGCRRWLDHCIVTESASQTIVKVSVLEDVFVSDHLPLVIECNLNVVRAKIELRSIPRNSVVWGNRNEAQVNKYRELCNKRLREIDFPSEFTGCSHQSCNLFEHRSVLDRLYNSIVQILCSSAEETSVERRCVKQRNQLCGWNKHVRESHTEARLKFKVWVLYNRPVAGFIYDQMYESRKTFKSRLKWCQNNQEQLKMDILAKHRSTKSFSKFWKATGSLEVRSGLPVSIDGLNEPVKIANMFSEHFRVSSPLGSSDSSVDRLPLNDESPINFSAKEIRHILKKMSGGKSPGHDGLSIEHLRFAGVHLPRVLSMFFALCLNHSYLPYDLMKTIVVPIVKNKTGDISDRGNYRPISLATVIAKVLDGLLDSRLENHLNLHDAQFGFRPGLSTESAIASVKHAVRYYTDRRTPVFACFLDLSKAFDLVSYDVLWRKLGDRGVPNGVLSIFKYWYANQANFVRWADTFSDEYMLECGVRQGGLTSPKLFNIYMDELIGELSSMRVGCSIDGVSINNISYADDMVLLSPTARGLAGMLRVCERYAIKHGLAYNVKKTEYMVFEVSGKASESSVGVTLNGVSIKRVTRFKYLGHILTSDLKDDADIERERRALAVKGNMLARRFCRCTEEVKVTLFKAYCQSMYTASLWVNHTKRSLEALRIQYNNIFRVLLGLPRFCSASGMFAEYQTDGFNAVLRKKTVSLINRVRGSRNGILQILADRFTSPLWRCLIQRVIPEPRN